MKHLSALILFLIAITSPAAAIDVGGIAPDFTLNTYDGTEVSLKSLKDEVVVLEWFNNGCPFVQKHYRNGDMQKLQKQFAEQNVVWLAINSTNADHSDHLDSEAAAKIIEDWNISSAKLLHDKDGTVGKAYGAKTTPHLFVINKGTVVYRGAIDDNSSAYADPKEANNYVQAALSEVLEAKDVSKTESKPYGCSVKYAE